MVRARARSKARAGGCVYEHGPAFAVGRHKAVGLGKRFKRHWRLLLLLLLLFNCRPGRGCCRIALATVARRCERWRHRHETPCGGVGGVRASAPSRGEPQIVRFVQPRQLQPSAANATAAVGTAAVPTAATAAAYAEHRAIRRAQAGELPPRRHRHLVRVNVRARVRAKVKVVV